MYAMIMLVIFHDLHVDEYGNRQEPYGDQLTRRSQKIIDNHMAPAGCRTRRHASRERLQT